MRAVDSSYDPLTQEEAACLAESGWPVFIQCLWTGTERPDAAIANLLTALDAGLLIGAYLSLTSDATGARHVERGLGGLPVQLRRALQQPGSFVAVDVELPDITTANIIEACRHVEGYGYRTAIYTSYNAWVNYVIPSNSDALSRLGYRLWNAYWDYLDSDIGFPHLPYGGWTLEQVILEQYSGGTYICGQFTDRNIVVDPSFFEKEEHMPTQEYDELTESIRNTQAVLEIVAKELEQRIGALQDGSTEIQIWPVGRRPLSEVRHRGYHSFDQVQQLTEALRTALNAVSEHVNQHNISGGPADLSSKHYLTTLTGILTRVEDQVREMKETGVIAP